MDLAVALGYRSGKYFTVECSGSILLKLCKYYKPVIQTIFIAIVVEHCMLS